MSKNYTWLVPPLAIALSLTLSACGKKEEPQTAAPAQPAVEASKPAEPAQPAETPVAAASAENGEKGEKVFKSTCSMCHQTGAAGAPILGNKGDWGPRITQGKPTLYEHALKGFTGTKGMMPAKGGNASLVDDDVKAAVDYMVSKAQ